CTGRSWRCVLPKTTTLKSEDAFVLPEVRGRFDEAEQLRIVQRLIVDQEAADPGWVVEWLSNNLNADALQVLSDLTAGCLTGSNARLRLT
ncbi:MAG: hypothetical protein ACE5Q6_25585, partial [Dehalococcoidia bacterium]